MNLADLAPDVAREHLEPRHAELKRRAKYQFRLYFPDCVPGVCDENSFDESRHMLRDVGNGVLRPICRKLYVRHLQFIAAGKMHRERMFLAANRIGKTQAAAYEITAHLTGLYPHWWHGKTYDRPTRWWAAGDSMLSTRDILQVSLLGPVDNVDTGVWTGMLPNHLVAAVTRKSGGIAKCIDQITVIHASGGHSVLEFKSYEQGRKLFQGTEQEGIWLDEEPPQDVYAECLTRTLTTEGLVINTFTPLQGLTEFLTNYLQTAVMLDTKGEERSAYNVFFPEAA